MALTYRYPSLTTRQEIIFTSLLKQYVRSAYPISSRHLANQLKFQLSPATIRNELSELEDLGLLEQPHVSAGRVPSELGYGFYVDSLMKTFRLSKQEKEAIINVLHDSFTGNIREMLERISVALSRVTALISIVLSPKFSEEILHKIDLISIASGRILVVLTLRMGNVKSIILEVDSSIQEPEVQCATQFLNERLSGLKLPQVRSKIREMLKGAESTVHPGLIKLVIDYADDLFDQPRVEVYIGETRHVMAQPEFSDLNRMREFFDLIENKEGVVELLSYGEHQPAQGVRIAIGQELPRERLHDCSMVTASYSVGEMEGYVAVIGPTRMPYDWVASLAKFTADGIRSKMVD